MKKILLIFGLILCLTGCGNYDVFEMEYTFNKAYC